MAKLTQKQKQQQPLPPSTDILPITYAHVKWFFLFFTGVATERCKFEFAMELECDLGAIQNEELLRKMVSESQSYVSISLCLRVEVDDANQRARE